MVRSFSAVRESEKAIYAGEFVQNGHPKYIDQRCEQSNPLDNLKFVPPSHKTVACTVLMKVSTKQMKESVYGGNRNLLLLL